MCQMDAAELSELIELHGKAIYSFCYHLTQKKDTADDLYQDTFLKVLELQKQFNRNRNPKSLLISIAIGLWKNQCRKSAWRERIAPTSCLEESEERISPVSNTSTPEQAVLNQELHDLVAEAAASLHDKFRLPLYLYYTADLSIEEISAALRIPAGTVKSRLHKARKLLKSRLEVLQYEII